MEWKEVKADEFCTKVTDGTHDSPKQKEEGHYLITSKHLQEQGIDFNKAYRISEEDYQKVIARSKVDQYDILFSMIGTIGNIYRVTIPNVDFAVKNMGIFKMGGDAKKSLWLYYWLKSPKAYEYINSTLAGSTQSYLTLKSLREFPVKFPDNDNMSRIASILSSLDSKIETNNKINAKLEEMAQALFKSWFVDFEPFKDGEFEESELGRIPKGWKVYLMDELVDNISGYSYKGSELQNSNVAMATIKNFVRGGGFKIEGYKEIVITKKIKDIQFVDLFDVLVAHTDLTQNAEVVGNPALILSKSNYNQLIMSMDLTKVISKDKRLSNAFIYSILNTTSFKAHALGYVNGTTVLHMSKKAVPEYKVALPSDFDSIQEVVKSLDSIYQRMSITFDENLRLSRLRDTLLPKLMNGEIEL